MFGLTDLELDFGQFAPTAPVTRQGTPFDVPVEKSHIMIKELDSGAFGTVWKAVDRSTGDFLAVKKIRKSVNYPRSLREVKLMNELQHVCGFNSTHQTYLPC